MLYQVLEILRCPRHYIVAGQIVYFNNRHATHLLLIKPIKSCLNLLNEENNTFSNRTTKTSNSSIRWHNSIHQPLFARDAETKQFSASSVT